MEAKRQRGEWTREEIQRHEAARRARIRQDASRPMSVNLAEGISWSHEMLRFAGSVRRK